MSNQCYLFQIQMAVRNFEYKDLEEVWEIAKEALEENYTMDFLLYLWQINPDGFLVAEKNGKIVGFILSAKQSKDELRILMLAVKKEYRGQGIGSMLLKELLLKFPEVRRIYLEVKVENKKAIKFYKKHGFKIKEKLDNFYTDGSSAYLMEKILY
ncbi:MAG TPA: ribosomal-protein-alanine N-acetyltransferase [Thermoplasmatales archaeon]|nr:ribosomal-protein-alanine N-acetyltransferase [Thermoplasmatales archaeon]